MFASTQASPGRRDDLTQINLYQAADNQMGMLREPLAQGAVLVMGLMRGGCLIRGFQADPSAP
jgi:hypothetical protein